MGPAALSLPLPPGPLEGPPPPSDRSRFNCLSCRTRKVRCDRLVPQCTTCQQWKVECQYQLTPARLRKTLVSNPYNAAYFVPVRPALVYSSTSPTGSSSPPTTTTSISQPKDLSLATIVKPAESRYLTPESATLPDIPGNIPGLDGLGIGGLFTQPLLDGILMNSPESCDGTDDIIAMLLTATPTSYSDIAGPEGNNVNHITSKWLLNSMGKQPPTPEGHVGFNPLSATGNQGMTAPSFNEPAGRGLGITSLRSLVVPTDLLYHSSVVRHSIANFCSFIYQNCNPLNSARVLFRLDNQLIPKSFQLATMLAVAPFSDHPAFKHLSAHAVSLQYLARLHSMIPFCLEDSNPDMLPLLGILSETSLGLGRFSLHQSLIAVVLRKQQVARIHLMDHPHPPPRPAHRTLDPDSGLDAPTLSNEILREYYRVAWWAFVHKDMNSALVFGHMPLVDLDDCFVNLPCSDHDAEARLDAELATPHSDIFTSQLYPTLINKARIKNMTIVARAEVTILGHQVARLRARQASDPTAWLKALPGLNRELDQWYNHFTHWSDLDRVNPQSHPVPPASAEAKTICFQARVTCAMLAIYLNHFDGHSPDSSEPFPGSALNSALRAAGDSTGRTLSECHERCWLYTDRLHEVIVHLATPPAFINTGLFISALYSAAIVCTEQIHILDCGHSSPVVREGERQPAVRFIEEIMQILTSFSDVWMVNSTIIAEIRKIRDSPFMRRRLSIEHLVNCE
ncbi:hypothetical protein H4R33_005788 [Dimargaris cristalligena]|uniref:Zn(2)-C6 fungal-type domain-containing protein n=1 Tax=Dimargaris cristalligena TaxID=215637 RepID=A0A4V1J4L1_9FUNG|nr:hypothetical protein H4R33_005788 [Dimargaris cristalligena]RKP35939.1 hypothetical protein BJ085DRAFT_35483 [Dimargaris cristalligena]|eukprot:RKP35939.1 hypothetical protein BJ085DRAFT_35483 [Dimargaris cristalligena]